jgi:hypothetical protein
LINRRRDVLREYRRQFLEGRKRIETMRKMICMLALLSAFFTVGPFAVATSGVAEARVCKHKYLRSWGKRHSTMYAARISARRAWKRASYALYGTKFDTWWPSRRKSMRCYPSRHHKHRCLATAFPCTIF